MKASDFRIGNWVKDSKGKIFQLDIEDMKLLHLVEFGSLLAKPDILPIELTTDWLHDFEWECIREGSQDEDLNGLWMCNGIQLFEDVWTENNKFQFATRVEGDGEFKAGFSVPHVHQLQNIYHSLCQQELTRLANKR